MSNLVVLTPIKIIEPPSGLLIMEMGFKPFYSKIITYYEGTAELANFEQSKYNALQTLAFCKGFKKMTIGWPNEIRNYQVSSLK